MNWKRVPDLLLFAGLAFVPGCGGGGGGASGSAPLLSSYGNPAPTYAVCFGSIVNAPVFSGAVDSWSIDPALPAGLAFDTVTGEITGDPTVVTAAADYTITATNGFGSDTFVLTLEVSGNPPTAAFDLALDSLVAEQAFSTQLAATGSAQISAIQLTAGTLPAGVDFDESTGTLSGASELPWSEALQFSFENCVGEVGTLDVELRLNGSPASAAYLLDQGTMSLATLLLDSTSGQPTLFDREPLSAGILDLCTDPQGRFAYGIDDVGDTVHIFELQGSGGRLESSGSFGLNLAGTWTRLLALHGGTYLIVTDDVGGFGAVLELDPTSGAVLDDRYYQFVTQTLSDLELGVLDDVLYLTDPSAGVVSSLVIAPTTVGASNYPFTGTAGVLAVHPSGDFLLHLNAEGDAFDVFMLDSDGHLLGANTTFATTVGVTPSDMVFDRSGRWLYVADTNTGQLIEFAVDRNTGEPSFLDANPEVALAGPAMRLVIDPEGRFLYATESTAVLGTPSRLLEVFALEVDGHLTPSEPRAVSLAEDPFALVFATGAPRRPTATHLFAVVEEEPLPWSFTIDPTTQQLEDAQQAATADGQVDPVAIVARPHHDQAFLLDFNTGATTAVVRYDVDTLNSGLLVNPADLGLSSTENVALLFTPSGAFAYVVWGSAACVIEQYAVDAAGDFTFVSSSMSGAPGHPAMHPSGLYLYVPNVIDNAVEVFSIDVTTGLLTSVEVEGPVLNPLAVLAEPSGRYLHVLSLSGTEVVTYSVDPASGALTALSAAPVDCGLAPNMLWSDASGLGLFVSDAGTPALGLFSADDDATNLLEDGALTTLGSYTYASGSHALLFAPGTTRAFTGQFGGGGILVLDLQDPGEILQLDQELSGNSVVSLGTRVRAP